jgi:hypothetical protein
MALLIHNSARRGQAQLPPHPVILNEGGGEQVATKYETALVFFFSRRRSLLGDCVVEFFFCLASVDCIFLPPSPSQTGSKWNPNTQTF